MRLFITFLLTVCVTLVFAQSEETIVIPKQDYVSTIPEMPQPIEQSQELPTKTSVLSRYYTHSGHYALWYIHVGYTYNIPAKRHNINFSTLDFRLGWWGLSPLSFEAVVPQDYKKEDSELPRISYSPSMRFFAPCTKWLAVSPMMGVNADMSYFNQYVKRDCEFDYERDFYLTGRAGLSFFITGLARLPVELSAEYRFPIIVPESGPYHDRGFYLSGHLYFGSCFK